HASAGSATICVHPDGDEIQVWIRDNGNGIAVTHLHRATLECGFTTSDSLGCGFFIILNTIDSLSLLTNTSGTTIVLSQKIGQETSNPKRGSSSNL
ncbi:MAG: hypothetical protein H8F28_11695, partial [Fibrella sp.]|nr:hypothetical protein [Armatimonadota bacterium]